jgi:hypothetical protein
MMSPTTNVDVVCTQGHPASSSVTEAQDDTEIKNREELYKKPLKPPDKKSSSLDNHPIREARNTNVVLIDHSTDETCPANDRDVDAVAQLTGSWCWAASAEAVMKFHQKDDEFNANQCNIVNSIFNTGQPTDKDEDSFCCINENRWDGGCQHNGWPEYAFHRYGFKYKVWNVAEKGPMFPEEIKGQLCYNGPFILVLEYMRDGRLSGGGHTLVIGDYLELNGKFHLLVHDHDYYIEGPKRERIARDFQLWSYEDYVKARWGGAPNRHSLDYVKISNPAH